MGKTLRSFEYSLNCKAEDEFSWFKAEYKGFNNEIAIALCPIYIREEPGRDGAIKKQERARVWYKNSNRFHGQVAQLAGGPELAATPSVFTFK